MGVIGCSGNEQVDRSPCVLEGDLNGAQRAWTHFQVLKWSHQGYSLSLPPGSLLEKNSALVSLDSGSEWPGSHVTVLMYLWDHEIIVYSTLFHSEICPGLDDKLCGHPTLTTWALPPAWGKLILFVFPFVSLGGEMCPFVILLLLFGQLGCQCT